MRILNKKCLVVFAASDSPADKEGYLYKHAEDYKDFRKLWFTLKGNLLFYYVKKNERKPLGVIILEGYTVHKVDNIESFLFILISPGVKSRSYCLGANSQEDMESWTKALCSASYEATKLKILELESKLEKLSVTGVKLVHDAARDAEVYGQLYASNTGCFSSLIDKQTVTVSGVNIESVASLSIEQEHGDVDSLGLRNSTTEIITWSKLCVSSFIEMHAYVEKQMMERK